MGVFARLLGRSKAGREASATAARAGTEPEAAEAEAAGATGTGPAEATDASGDGHGDGAVHSDSGTDDASEGAGIPRQQSAGEAVDSEAGDNARR
ncbi:hypothetical protein HKX69_08740 [Streptomyces argyrophyllae]|uniref:Uncharacterized protein n=1 Tax=Streptomyces argyrophylli TaxID=2726118 RepID=A0A6M4PHM7_9ACTN|nr:hypothetical protein [Streptomyces argyrophyllae]QJS09603.1 hypothetical protein HKX69_08740 [Streptomyces argyrophyllae]